MMAVLYTHPTLFSPLCFHFFLPHTCTNLTEVKLCFSWIIELLLCFLFLVFLLGLSCDHCEFGYWNLSHPNGCVPCDCDPSGSLSLFCEPQGGQCECKPGVGGRRCDSCASGSFALSLEGSCSLCNCSEKGTVSGTVCDPHTGQCVCKASTAHTFYWAHKMIPLSHSVYQNKCILICIFAININKNYCINKLNLYEYKKAWTKDVQFWIVKDNVVGRRCYSCRPGYHTLDHRNSLGCLPCVCDLSGTLPGAACDIHTGQCPCKEGVEGAQCTNCAYNYYNQSTAIHSKTCLKSYLTLALQIPCSSSALLSICWFFIFCYFRWLVP